MDRINRHKEIIDELHETYKRKNRDYGNSYSKLREEYPDSILIRLSDKLERLKTLKKNGTAEVKDESIRDTLLDLANYAIMEVVEMEDTQVLKDYVKTHLMSDDELETALERIDIFRPEYKMCLDFGHKRYMGFIKAIDNHRDFRHEDFIPEDMTKEEYMTIYDVVMKTGITNDEGMSMRKLEHLMHHFEINDPHSPDLRFLNEVQGKVPDLEGINREDVVKIYNEVFGGTLR